jgi:hypothetical protein
MSYRSRRRRVLRYVLTAACLVGVAVELGRDAALLALAAYAMGQADAWLDR